MIIEWIINAVIAIIKLPFYLIDIPSVNINTLIQKLNPYIASGVSFVKFFFDDFAVTIIGFALTVLAIFKVIDIISTIVGFFKKTRSSGE